MLCVQDEMLPPEHMERMHKLLLANKGQVTWVPIHAGHMDAYETNPNVCAACCEQNDPCTPDASLLCILLARHNSNAVLTQYAWSERQIKVWH